MSRTSRKSHSYICSSSGDFRPLQTNSTSKQIDHGDRWPERNHLSLGMDNSMCALVSVFQLQLRIWPMLRKSDRKRMKTRQKRGGRTEKQRWEWAVIRDSVISLDFSSLHTMRISQAAALWPINFQTCRTLTFLRQ